MQGGDFKLRLNAALAHADARTRLAALAALAQQPLGFIETLQLDNAVHRLPHDPHDDRPALRVALLSTHTVEHLLPAVRVCGLRRGLRLDVHAGSFGQYRNELLDPASWLGRFRPDVIVLSLAADGTLPAVPLGASAQQVDDALHRVVDDLRSLWRHARETLHATVIQQSVLDVAPPLFGNHDRLVPAAPSRLVGRLNDLLADAVHDDGVLLLDVAHASARDGLDAWFDVARWLQGKMEIAPQAAPRYADLLTRLLGAQLGRSRKCLVLDLDNTLWGGVVGEVGTAGLVLGQGSAHGEAHLALQRYALALKERGVILAVCSKNEESTAKAAFRDHPEMALRLPDIAAFVANWDDKAENLRRIAQQLNIGLDSLVFVDDNPAERARVREALPMVAVPELPADPAHYVRRLAEEGLFESVSFTAEDLERADQYASNSARDALLGASASMEDFLRSLEMSLDCGPVTPLDLPRVAQLINKTNQFNVTARRCPADEVARLVAATGNIALQFRLADRFGDNGLVSAMILVPAPGDPDVLDVDTWVMSCRVFGRQLEEAAMNVAVQAARARGARALRGRYVRTDRNGVVASLFERLGFVQQPDGGGTRWQLDLAGYREHPTSIVRKAS
jgi:FkbH-like protein